MGVVARPATVAARATSSSFFPGLHCSQSFVYPLLRRNLSSSALHPTAKLGRCAIQGSHPSQRNSNAPSTTPTSFFTPSLCRHASTSSSSATTASASPSVTETITGSISNTNLPPASVLDWNTFFKLRTSHRRYSLISSVVSSFISTGGCIFTISSYPDIAEAITKIVPLEPVASMGIATFASTLLGWLIGPFFGNAIWRALHTTRLPEFIAKEKAFFERIKKHRVDPNGASTTNPVPDYYGEKIGSVAGYRSWLKDQRAFNRKRTGNFIS